jgi:hypothetical protein
VKAVEREMFAGGTRSAGVSKWEEIFGGVLLVSKSE